MDSFATDDSAKMLWAVAEQLKVPLSLISRQAELAQLSGDYSAQGAADIRVQADIGLALVDSYLLGLSIWRDQTVLPLEAVSASSVLADTAHALYKYSRQMGVKLEVSIEGRYGPVMANPKGFRAAMLSLGCALIESAGGGKTPLKLVVHRSDQGLAVGMYGVSDGLDPEQWRSAQKLSGQAKQPLPSLHASGAGLFVADAILQAMESRLAVARHGRQLGLRATFQPSYQLTLV